jgi:hypothetical protein
MDACTSDLTGGAALSALTFVTSCCAGHPVTSMDNLVTEVDNVGPDDRPTLRWCDNVNGTSTWTARSTPC